MSMNGCGCLGLIGATTVLGLAIGCGGSSSASPSPGGGGTTAALDAAYAFARQQVNLTSLVVAHDGVIDRQEYSNGGGADTPQDIRSGTKSVVSLLVGIALDRGCLRSLDQTVGELLGPLGPSDPARAAVTVRHLLTMSSGIGGDELADVGEYNRWAAAPNQVAYVWDQPLLAPPGTRFSYFSAAYHVLSPILTRACGLSTADFARDSLFGPLGIGSRQWEVDRQDYNNAAAGLRLTPMDMVAIGNLVLAGGQAGGRQVVPASWIRDATRTQMATSAQAYASGYGFGWWTGQTAGSDFTFANGFGGQFIVVVPRVGLVVTATNRWQGVGSAVAAAQWMATLDIIMRRIVPAY
ncbi:MAG TPA: serine hydrolase [Vicinamibacterales bacterium]|jgi:CubicO group peptidase (beta-lactamase class C family)